MAQSIGVSASGSILPMNIQGWFPLGLIGLISLLSKGLSRVFSSTRVQKHQVLGTQPSLWSNSHIGTWLLEKPYLWLYGPFSGSGSFPNEMAYHIRWPKFWASPSVLQVKTQGWFTLGLTGLISLLPKGLTRIFSNTTVQKHQFLQVQPSSWSKYHILTWLLEKP